MIQVEWKVEKDLNDEYVKYEDRLREFDQYDYALDTEKYEKEIRDVSVRSIEVIRGGSTYWSGILFEEPWDELEMEYTEEDILQVIMEYHLNVVEGVLVFELNGESPLNEFFLKHADGYGGNIPHNVEELMGRVIEEVNRRVEEDSDAFFMYVEEE